MPESEPAAVNAEEDDELEAHVVELALSGQLAHVGLEAVANHRRLGLPITVRRGQQIVTIHPDGREEVVRELPRLRYTVPAEVLRLGPE